MSEYVPPTEVTEDDAGEQDELLGEEGGHNPENWLEQKVMQSKRQWIAFRKKFRMGPPPPDPTAEEKKMNDIADIIKTYRHVDMEKDEEHVVVLWVDRPAFDLTISLVIVVNTIVLGIELDVEHGSTEGRHWAFILLEVLFCLTWITEIALKIRVHTWKWIFMDPWNLFTLVIASFSIIDGAILGPLGLHGRLRLLSLMRVIGLLRLIKVIRQFRSLKELRLVMQGLMGSLVMLTWTVIILVVFLFVSAIFTTSTVGRNDDYIDVYKLSNGWDQYELFGSVGRSMWTLLTCMTRDGWASHVARYVVEQEFVQVFFFFVFMLMSTYGLLNLVVSVIVEQTLNAARSNEDKVRVKEERNKKNDLEDLKEIFLAADEDGNGELDMQEFLNALEDEEIHWRMHALDLNIEDCAGLFAVVDGDGARALSMDEFIDGCTKLKGVAKNKDLLAITAQADTLAYKMDELGEQLVYTEKMLNHLDVISLSITNRFKPSIKSSRKKIAKSVGGSAPIVPMPHERLGSAMGVDLGAGNRPLMPPFPNLLK